MEVLKNCPFCGYSASGESWKARKGYEAVAQCNRCGANITTITYDTEEEAAQAATEAWNRRAPCSECKTEQKEANDGV
ncbi:MAG: Lar family restriction alleviation protein [Alphaproteobacteria bacterium]|nr:Lar family restriction alleviation protein [Alphaproteobacteria bacterium]